ncbi:MAG: hypothetical protein HYT12_00775 [Candidatus Liptonbacteria bacterium]|nr:hypothetical protein [Candidatus Liptonbacteria bacterium]
MPKKQTLAVAELKSLLLARFNAGQSKQAKLQARLQQELGNEVQEEKPEAIAIKNKFADWISDVLARRLKQNRRTTPLLSSRDFVKFVPSMIDEIAKIEGGELEAEERKMFEKFMKAMFENIFEMVHAMVPPRKNPYEEYWRWTTTVLDLAAERGILPTELLALENATDEITRRMFTKKQFVALSKKAVNKLMDADMLKKIIVQPMLDMVAEGDEKERRELEQELETELMPQLRETVEKSKVVINAWLGEEVERIYAAA